MAITLNEYATKAFSEHPIALWSLDDDAYFVSLVEDGSTRLFDQGAWDVSPNCILTDYPQEPNVSPAPFIDGTTSMVSTLTPFNGEILELISPEIFTFDQFNNSLGSFCINFWLYQRSVGVVRYEIGYRYLNIDNEEVEMFDIVPAVESARDTWVNFNMTNAIPPNAALDSWLKIVIRIVLSEPVSPTQEYKFIFNGLSIGQWSELSCYKNLGAIPITLDSFNFNGSVEGITADQYGLLSENSYYLVEDKIMLSDNTGLSLVYGSENSTNVYPSSYGNPSFIFPGKDMLHEMGRYKQFTLEMWINIDVSTEKSLKILGPLDSDFGVYVKKGVISLLVGNRIASHSVSEWYRPMLIHLLIQETSITLVINGEQVASVPIDRNTIDLPDTLNWWGVYSYPEVSQFKIDCISVYPYIMPLQVSKKRFVWGQGVDTIQFIDGEFSGTTAAMDFTTSNYDVNQVYPDLGRWDAGYFDNLSVTSTAISLPEYSLPERYLGGAEGSSASRNIDDWYDANKTVNLYEGGETFITFRPNVSERFNYFYKPSLETLKWTDYGTSSGDFSTEYSFVGTKSLEVTLQGIDTSVSAPHGFDDFEISETGTYWASAYFYIPEDPLQQLDGKTITLTLEDGWGEAEVLETNVATLNLGEWVRASIKFSVDDTVYLGRIVARISENINDQKLYTDAWMVEKTEDLQPYFDGDSSQYANWVGTPHSAVSRLEIWNPIGSDWTERSYFTFDWIKMFRYPVNSIFGTFEINQILDTERPLIHLVNGNQRLEINLIGDEVQYRFNSEDSFVSDIITLNQKFVVGFNIEKLSQYFGSSVIPFFSSTGSMRMYVGGSGPNGTNLETFEGKIFKVGVMNQTNYENFISLPSASDLDNEWAYTTFFESTVEGGFPDSYFENEVDGGVSTDFSSVRFNEYGITEQLYTQDFDNLYTMYSLIPMYTYNRVFLDIEVASEWEEYYPLSFFATYVKDSEMNLYYDLDSLQINIGYASKKDFITIANEQEFWNYGGAEQSQSLDTLYNDYRYPITKTYSALDNEIITNYESYENLKRKAEIEKVFDFSESSFVGYLTFQLLSDESDSPLSNFINNKRLDQSRVIVADEVNTPTDSLLSFKTKFEFTDNVVVYPPKSQTLEGTDLSLENMVMVVHLSINHKGVLSNPLTIRDFEICSRTSNETIPTEIGTKYGTPMYTYVKDADTYKYKEFNPLVIYKKNTPYLYTTSRSGIRIGNVSVGERQYGVKVPINDSEAQGFEVAAIQFWQKYDFTKFAKNGISVMEIEHKGGVYEVLVMKDHSEKRGLMKIVDKITKEEITGVLYYQNGVYVKYPIIKLNEWNSIAITFLSALSYDQYSGGINLLAGVTFNNISYYKPSGLGRLSNLFTRPWIRVLRSDSNPSENLRWSDWYWKNEQDRITNSWKEVLVFEESISYISTPEDIHKAYMGTNKSIVGDDQTFGFSNKEFLVVNDVSWSRISGKPV